MSIEKDGPAIYVLRNRTTNKVYVGSSIKGRRRLTQHKRSLKLNCHVNRYLQFAYNKHGEADFEFVIHEKCEADNRLDREQFWIDQMQASDPAKGYNVSHSVVTLAPAKLRSEISKSYWRDLSQEEREAASQSRRVLWDDPEWRAARELELAEKGAKQRAKRKADPDFNARCLSGLKRQQSDPDAQVKRAAKIRETWARPEVRAAQAARKQALAKDPAYMAKHLERAGKAESKAKLRAHNKAQWADPEIKAKRLDGLRKGREAFWSDPVKRAERLELLSRSRSEAAAKRKSQSIVI